MFFQRCAALRDPMPRYAAQLPAPQRNEMWRTHLYIGIVANTLSGVLNLAFATGLPWGGWEPLCLINALCVGISGACIVLLIRSIRRREREERRQAAVRTVGAKYRDMTAQWAKGVRSMVISFD